MVGLGEQVLSPKEQARFEFAKKQCPPPMMFNCVLYAAAVESYMMSCCCEGGVTQSLAPLNNKVGTETYLDASTADGLVFAAANETRVVIVVLSFAARKALPPPMECPMMADVVPTLADGISMPAPLL